MKHEYCHLKDLDLQNTDTGPVQLIIGTNNSDLILPQRIVKPSGQSGVDRIPYAVETSLGWAVTNWLPGEQREASPYNAFKVYGRGACEDEELTRLVMAQSEIETLGVGKLANPTCSIEDKRALSLMERTTVKVPLGRKFVGLFRPNSVAEYRVLFIFHQKTEQQTFHPNIF